MDAEWKVADQYPDNMPIEEIGLPTRLRRALTNEGIRTVGDVRNLSDIDLLCVRRIGGDSFRVLRRLLGPTRGAQNKTAGEPKTQ